MIQQFVFLVLLQSIGGLFALSFRKRLPLTFLLISGLLWGSLFWVIGSVSLLVLHLPYTLLTTGLWMIALLMVFLAWNVRRKNLHFDREEAIQLAIWQAISLGIFALTSKFNLTFVSPDSLIMILNGRAFVTQGFSPFIRMQLALRGVFVPAVQAASPLLGIDYLYALQPAIILVSTALFVYFSWRILGHLNTGKRPLWMPILLLLVMISSYYLPFQTFYLHTNLLSGAYLMVTLACFWIALEEKNYAWLVFAILALTAFSLLRTEAPLFSLLFLALLLSNTTVPYRVRLATCLPFAAMFVVWYIYLLAGMGSGTYILNPSNILLMLAALLGMALLVAASRWAWIEYEILPRLPWIMLVASCGLCVVLFALDSTRMWAYLKAMLLNLSVYGLWGVGWFLVAAGLLLAIALPSIPHERLYSFGIPVFLILLYAISTRNIINQLDWGDSANRMLTHIFPAAFLYLSMKFSRGLQTLKEDIEPVHSNRLYILSALGMGLIVFVLVLSR